MLLNGVGVAEMNAKKKSEVVLTLLGVLHFFVDNSSDSPRGGRADADPSSQICHSNGYPLPGVRFYVPIPPHGQNPENFLETSGEVQSPELIRGFPKQRSLAKGACAWHSHVPPLAPPCPDTSVSSFFVLCSNSIFPMGFKSSCCPVPRSTADCHIARWKTT